MVFTKRILRYLVLGLAVSLFSCSALRPIPQQPVDTGYVYAESDSVYRMDMGYWVEERVLIPKQQPQTPLCWPCIVGLVIVGVIVWR